MCVCVWISKNASSSLRALFVHWTEPTYLLIRFCSTGNLVAVTMVTFFLTTLLTYASIVCCKRLWKKARGPLTANRTPNVSCSTSMSINGLMAASTTSSHATCTLLPIDASALLSSSGSTSDIASTVASLPSTVSYPSAAYRNVHNENHVSNCSHAPCRTTDFIRLMPMTTNNTSRPLSSLSSSTSAQVSFLTTPFDPPPPYSSVPYATIRNTTSRSHCSYSSSSTNNTIDTYSTAPSTSASETNASETAVKRLPKAAASAAVEQFLQAFATPRRKDVVFPKDQNNMPQLKRTLTR